MSRPRIFALTVALLLLIVLGTPLFAGGAQEPEAYFVIPPEVSFAYIPGQDFTVTGALQVTYRSPREEEFFVVADYGDNQANCPGGAFDRCVSNPLDPSDLVAYQLRNDQGGVVLDISDATASTQVFTGEVEPTSRFFDFRTVTVPINLFVAAGQLLDPNPAYEDNVSLRLYYGSIDDPDSYNAADPDAATTLTVLGNVPPFVELALVNPGGTLPLFGRPTNQTMDFGILEPGETQAYDLLVETNAPFTIAIESENGGVLAYEGTNFAVGLPEVVDYELWVNGQVADLGGGTTIFGSGLSGLRWPFVVEILDFDVPVAGSYRDILDITVSTDQ